MAGVGVQITTGGGFARVGAAFQAAGRALPGRLQVANMATGRALAKQLHENAERILPRRGGLAALVAASDFEVSPSGRSGVEVTIAGSVNLGSLDAGVVQHPVFGHESVFVSQRIDPGWISDAAEDLGDQAADNVSDAVADVTARI